MNREPTYSLEEMQNAVRSGRYLVTRQAARTACRLEFDEDDIKACVLQLEKAAFYKTMPSRRISGLFQDVYKAVYLDVPIYTKLQLTSNQRTVVISFKRDESA